MIKVSGAGHLEHTGRILSAFPCAIIISATKDGTSASNQTVISQGQSNGDRRLLTSFTSNTAQKNIQHRSPSLTGSASIPAGTGPIPGATPQWFVAVYTSPTSRTIYYGSDTGVTDTTGTPANDLTFHDLITIGAGRYNSGVASGFAKSSLGEAHFINGSFDSTMVGELIAGTTKPEEFTGWVDGWTLKDFNSDGTYLSMSGTRTLTAIGTVEASAVTHPVTRASAGDTTAPVLSLPVGASSGTTTATGSVTTDEANGTLYKLTSTNATETSATIIASGATQTVTATGVQNITSSGLTASTTYYHHFVHKDAADNTSNVVSSAAFTTSAAGDSTAPVLSSPTATATNSTTATGTVSTTNDANGALYRYASTNATETAGTIKAANLFQTVTATGVQNVTVTGLPPATAGLRIHYVHRDAAGNDSNVVSSAAFTTPASSAATLSFTEQLGNSATGPLASTTCTALVHSIAGALLVTRTGLATDANGRLVLPDITDAALVSGTNYRTIFIFASGAEGMINRVAA